MQYNESISLACISIVTHLKLLLSSSLSVQKERRVSQIRTSELEDQLDDRMAELRSSVATVQDLQTRLGRDRDNLTCSHTSLGKETLPEAATNMVTSNHHSLASWHHCICTTLSEILRSSAIDVASILL